MRLGYLGPAGTFSEEAARTAPDCGDAELVGLPTVRDTILAVHDGSVDRAIVPIENSVEGPIAVTLDTLADDGNDIAIVGEVVLAVSQHLIAGSPLQLAAIERVLSHPQAISQCARYLREQLPDAAIEPTASTAEAAQIVTARAEPWAALGTLRAAELYGAAVLARDVEDEPGNATRFVWLARRSAAQAPAAGASAKTSLSFWGAGDDSPGWLVRCLSEFAFRGVNLTKIESRPLRGRLGHYRFFVDCEGAASQPAVDGAIDGLRKHCEQVRILGTYLVAGPPD
ncbi:MAG: prephenate dehydratase [Solirubrobacteraceae bacterium]